MESLRIPKLKHETDFKEKKYKFKRARFFSRKPPDGFRQLTSLQAGSRGLSDAEREFESRERMRKIFHLPVDLSSLTMNSDWRRAIVTHNWIVFFLNAFLGRSRIKQSAVAVLFTYF